MSIYVRLPSRPVYPKAMLGPGAAAMLTQPMLAEYRGPMAQQKLMKSCIDMWKADPWIRAAERVISGRFSTVEWHLEDDNDAEIDDEYQNPVAVDAWTLMETPQGKLPGRRQVSRRDLWAMTSRDMGVTGNAFWYLDQRETVAQTPAAVLYIAPYRMSAATDQAGNLTGWVMDYNDRTGTGTPLLLDEVLQFMFE